MIYTVTFNPEIDYVVLHELGLASKALVFVAGFTGEAIEQGLRADGIETDFIHLEKGFSRINVKIKSGEETELNGQGPEIPEDKLRQLFDQLEQVQDGDTIILAGSIPASLPADVYKPNNFELGEIFGVPLKDDVDEIVRYAGKLQEMGARNVLVSMAGDGAVLLDENGGVHACGVCKGTVKNSVGAGDSMVAGFVAGCETGDYDYALKLGTATGGATAFSEGLAKKELIAELLQQLM